MQLSVRIFPSKAETSNRCTPLYLLSSIVFPLYFQHFFPMYIFCRTQSLAGNSLKIITCAQTGAEHMQNICQEGDVHCSSSEIQNLTEQGPVQPYLMGPALSSVLDYKPPDVPSNLNDCTIPGVKSTTQSEDVWVTAKEMTYDRKGTWARGKPTSIAETRHHLSAPFHPSSHRLLRTVTKSPPGNSAQGRVPPLVLRADAWNLTCRSWSKHPRLP